MLNRWFKRSAILSVLLMAAAEVSGGLEVEEDFTTLYRFEAAAPNTFTSDLGSQPMTLPALGPGNSVYA